MKPLKKTPDTIKSFRDNLNKDKFDSMNIYFQDESRFGLMTHIGRCLTARGIKPLVTYQHAFKNTYLYGSFSPINGDSFIWEIEGVNTDIFEAYLEEFSKQNPRELKIVIIDNAGFHSTKNINIPENIALVSIPSYCPELNPAEKIWQYLKERYKNQVFNTIENVKTWLCMAVNKYLTAEVIKSITHHDLYLNSFYSSS